MREIDDELPQRIYKDARERYLDEQTGHLIAVMNTELYGKTREVMVAYSAAQDQIILLTIHPLKSGQIDNRIRSGRWRKIQ
jgi:hypothetical protein